MKVVAIVSQKGGAGKTTVSTELAVMAVQNGYRTVVFDLDPQASAGVWADDRGGTAPQVISVPAPRLSGFLGQAADGGADLVLLDTAPHADAIAVAAARAADLVLIPCKPSPRDAKAIGSSLVTVADLAGKPCWVVINEAKAGTSMNRLMVRALEDAGVQVCPVQLGDRIAFVNALVKGQTASEWEPEGKAANEVAKLWKWLSRELGVPSSQGSGNPVKRQPGKPETRKSVATGSRHPGVAV
jgi:chromosome partitioning protein